MGTFQVRTSSNQSIQIQINLSICLNIKKMESTLTEMKVSAQTCEKSKQDIQIKKAKIFERLKSSSFSKQKGSQVLLEVINRQKVQMQSDSFDTTIQPREAASLLHKQQVLVMQLNQENESLIKVNHVLNQRLQSTDYQYRSTLLRNQELTEQNSSLKKQLHVSQSNSSKKLEELRTLKKQLNLLTTKSRTDVDK